jgi:hypothetical protein
MRARSVSGLVRRRSDVRIEWSDRGRVRSRWRSFRLQFRPGRPFQVGLCFGQADLGGVPEAHRIRGLALVQVASSGACTQISHPSRPHRATTQPGSDGHTSRSAFFCSLVSG